MLCPYSPESLTGLCRGLQQIYLEPGVTQKRSDSILEKLISVMLGCGLCLYILTTHPRSFQYMAKFENTRSPETPEIIPVRACLFGRPALTLSWDHSLVSDSDLGPKQMGFIVFQ